jgi:CheY-like chemotaxis protein
MSNPGTAFRYKKVMVIDDTQVDRYIAERNIKKYGFAEEVITFDSAHSALQFLSGIVSEADLPQYIFLDIRMPEIDGFGFLEQYALLPPPVKQHCIVMMLSTSLNPGDHERATNNQYVKRFLNKPLTREKLETIVNDSQQFNTLKAQS